MTRLIGLYRSTINSKQRLNWCFISGFPRNALFNIYTRNNRRSEGIQYLFSFPTKKLPRKNFNYFAKTNRYSYGDISHKSLLPKKLSTKKLKVARQD